jgi:hypothetical protein
MHHLHSLTMHHFEWPHLVLASTNKETLTKDFKHHFVLASLKEKQVS